ncbi:hypothetical protein V8C42DRAFT_298975 [Trichoderma barbatum]
MDPLSALAIAAAVFQFVDLGGKLLIHGWEKYKQMRQEMPGDQEFEEQQEELRRTFDDLSFRISGIRQVATDMNNSQEAKTPTRVQLLQLLSNCTSLSEDFEKIKDQIKPPISRKMKSEIHLHNHTGGYLNRPVKEEDCRECKKMKDEENAEFQKNSEDIERIKHQFEPLRRNVYDSVLLCLWDDSKRTKQWELQFNNKLDKVIDLLETAPNSTTVTLLQPGEGPLSLEQLANGISGYFRADTGAAMKTIRHDLLQILWAKDWKLDTSIAVESLVKIDTTMVAHAIAKGIRFNTIQSREAAIAKSFETTYYWIFQKEPSMKDEKPLWDSFPKWLEGDSNKVYWITGKPGSGKSTIMKLILQRESLWDTVSQSLGALRLLLVKYYAWHPGDTLQKSIDGLKKTVIFQAMEQYPELASVVAPRRWVFCQVLRRISDIPEWHEWEIEESFEALLSTCGKTIKLALFIDGLDEFDTPPLKVIQCIRHITAQCPSGLKLCVASRSWTEFQDEFSECPMLQMHLQSNNDMAAFITGMFNNNKGYIEQEKIYPQVASQLLADIAQRANGVFIWVSLVVNHLLDLLSEGESITRAQEALEALPTDISSLYDAIWNRIRPENLPDASYMMQVLRAADGPLQWFRMWLIEESRFARIRISALPYNKEWRDAAPKSLRRKLAARTKCILELSGSAEDGFVDFTHRTARDWAVQPKNWQLICSPSSDQFDPHLCILKAETLVLTDIGRILHIHVPDVEAVVLRALWHASEVKDTPQNTRDLVDCLNSSKNSLETGQGLHDPVGFSDGRIRFLSMLLGLKLIDIRKAGDIDFLELAAQLSVLPYINAVALSDRNKLSSSFSERSNGLLENAIFGFHYYHEPAKSEFRRQIPNERRLATVKYLLDQGVRQKEMHSRNGICNLRKELRRVSPDNPEYYSTVAMYLDRRNLKSSMRSIELRIRSWFS